MPRVHATVWEDTGTWLVREMGRMDAEIRINRFGFCSINIFETMPDEDTGERTPADGGENWEGELVRQPSENFQEFEDRAIGVCDLILRQMVGGPVICEVPDNQ